MTERNIMLEGMMGLIIGDALGCPVQFLSREQIRRRGPVIGMEGHGTFNMPVGTWTDDSSMALAELASINEKKIIDPDDMMQRFLDWEFDGAYTPFGKAFDEGNTCMRAIYGYKKNKDIKTCGVTGQYANGNGALMRILPVCLYYINRRNIIGTSDDEAIRGIHQVAGLTHNHLRSHMANGLYYFMAKAIVYNQSDGSLIDCLQKGLDDGFQFYGFDHENLMEMEHFGRLFRLNEFCKVTENDIKGSGYVVETLEAAVWCLVTTDNFKECLLRAVNLGQDTDTVAAIAGGLAGLFYGYDAIPSEWLNVIQRKEWIEQMCRNFQEG